MTQLAEPATTEPSPPRLRWTREMYEAAIEANVFLDRRVERLDEELYETPPQKLPHRTSLELIDDYCAESFPRTAFRVCVQMPLSVDDHSDPEPDVAVIEARDPRASSGHPKTAVLVVEVSDYSLRHDRRKASRYAAANVGEYWIIDLNGRAIEVYRRPDAASERYVEIRLYRESEQLTPLAAPDAAVNVRDLLP